MCFTYVKKQLLQTWRMLEDARCMRGCGERVDEMRKDVWPLYVDLVTSAAERAGLEFEVDVEDLLLIFEAIWHHPRTAASDQPGLRNRLITAVARHLTREKA